MKRTSAAHWTSNGAAGDLANGWLARAEESRRWPPVPVQPLRRRRSRLGEPTVRIELVVTESNGRPGATRTGRGCADMPRCARSIGGPDRSLVRVEIDDVSRVAVALDGVRESLVKGRLRWSLAGRLVARQLDDTSIAIRTGFAEREQLVAAHPTTFFVPPRFDAHMTVVAGLTDADPVALAAAIRAAWELQRSAA